MSPPLVSVVIPGYNCARYVAETLDSVLAQSYANFEVVFVDDGSTDATPDILAGYRDRIVYRRTANGGLAAARNAGMKLARGEFIAWLDADDVCDPDRLLVQSAYLCRRSEVVAVSSQFSAFDATRGVFDQEYAARYYSQVRTHGFGGLFPVSEPFDARGIWWMDGSKLPHAVRVHSGEVWRRLILGNFMHPPTLMLRRSARERVGWLREGLRMAEDWDYILRLAELGSMALIDAPLLRYRCHPGQMSGDSNSAQAARSGLEVLSLQLAEHPERVAGMEEAIHKSLASHHASIAYSLAEEERLQALGHLLQALRFDRKQANFGRNLARIMAGHAGLGLLRQLRGISA
ncbi:MAG: glycosyltransferase family 2 protein [Myxococcota bacterium]